MAATRTFLDPVPRVKHQQNTNREVSNFDTTVVGRTLYEGSHSHWEGMQTKWNGHKRVSPKNTENLEVTIRSFITREDFDRGDIVIMENGASIPAVFRQE